MGHGIESLYSPGQAIAQYPPIIRFFGKDSVGTGRFKQTSQSHVVPVNPYKQKYACPTCVCISPLVLN